MAARGNGGKIITGLIGLVLVLAGALANEYAKASNHISRMDAQAMVDRGDYVIKERLDRIDAKLDQLLAGQGGG